MDFVVKPVTGRKVNSQTSRPHRSYGRALHDGMHQQFSATLVLCRRSTRDDPGNGLRWGHWRRAPAVIRLRRRLSNVPSLLVYLFHVASPTSLPSSRLSCFLELNTSHNSTPPSWNTAVTFSDASRTQTARYLSTIYEPLDRKQWPATPPWTRRERRERSERREAPMPLVTRKGCRYMSRRAYHLTRED